MDRLEVAQALIAQPRRIALDAERHAEEAVGPMAMPR